MDIDKLVEFLYSSDTTEDVPFRLALISGQYSGFDLDQDKCRALLEFLDKPENYNKEKFKEFLKDIE